MSIKVGAMLPISAVPRMKLTKSVATRAHVAAMAKRRFAANWHAYPMSNPRLCLRRAQRPREVWSTTKATIMSALQMTLKCKFVPLIRIQFSINSKALFQL